MNAPASYIHPHIPTVGKSTKDVPVPVIYSPDAWPHEAQLLVG